METEQLTTASILSLFNTTKAERKSFVEDILYRIENGQDVLKTHLQIKAMEEIIKSLIDTNDKTNKNYLFAIRYKSMLNDAAEKYGKSFELHNAAFQMKETGTVYDWSKCNDPELAELLINQEEIKTKIKAKQDFLKTLSVSGLDIMIGDELVKVYPPAKSSTTTLSVTLK